MATPITIDTNSIIKFIARQGTQFALNQIALSRGEIGYTVDTKRLFVGDGYTLGGFVVGNKFLGVGSDRTVIGAQAVVSDVVYETTTNALYALTGSAATASDWAKIGGPGHVFPDNITIQKNANDTLSVLGVSGSSIFQHTLRNGLSATNNGLEIGSVIYTDQIVGKTDGTLTIPNQFTTNGNTFQIDADSLTSNSYLVWDGTVVGNTKLLKWTTSLATPTVVLATEPSVSVGMIVPFGGSGSIPSKFLDCDGSYKNGTTYPELCAALVSTWGPLSANGSNWYFRLPNLNGRFLMGHSSYSDNLSSYSFNVGVTGGKGAQQLTQTQLPSHSHTFASSSVTIPNHSHGGVVTGLTTGTTLASGGQYAIVTGSSSSQSLTPTVTLQMNATGSGAIYNNHPPFATVRYIIKALPTDTITSSNITVTNGLTSTSNAGSGYVNVSGGTIGLSAVNSTTTAQYGAASKITANVYGQVTSISQPQNSGTVKYLGNAYRVDLIKNIYGTTTINSNKTFSVNLGLTSSAIPTTAKNIVVLSRATADNGQSVTVTAYTAGVSGSDANGIDANTVPCTIPFIDYYSGANNAVHNFNSVLPLSGGQKIGFDIVGTGTWTYGLSVIGYTF